MDSDVALYHRVEVRRTIYYEGFALEAQISMTPCSNDVINLLNLRVPVHLSAINVPKKLAKDFLWNKVVEPVKTVQLISAMSKGSAPKPLAFALVNFRSGSALVKLKDLKSFSNGLLID